VYSQHSNFARNFRVSSDLVFGTIVSDVYRHEAGRRLVLYGFICHALFSISLYFFVRLPPLPNWHHQAEYELVLSSVFQVFIGNAIGVYIGSFLNIYTLSKWKNLVKRKYFITRCITASFTGEAITSIIADIIAFSNYMTTYDLKSIMLSIYCIKIF